MTRAETSMPPSSYSERNTCSVCARSDLTPFWEIEGLPVHCHLLCRTVEQSRQAPQGDVRLAFCNDCGHVLNTRFDPGLMTYAADYENSLHFSPRFQQYAESLADRLMEKHDLRDKDIVEIACGKGDFLRMLCERGGNRGTGYDPSTAPGEERLPGGGSIRLVSDYYTQEQARQSADVIICRHALEHLPEPTDFLRMIRGNLGDRREALVVFEVPNALFTLQQQGIWDVIYEHCSYFTPDSLTCCFEQAGFAVDSVTEQYGGQFLVIEARPSPSSTCTADRRTIQSIRGDVDAYRDHYHRNVAQWRERLDRWQQDDRRAVIWGSGSKAVTFLNIIQPGKAIEYVVDINPRKQGMHVTGAGQRIVAPAFLADLRPDYIVVMNPIYVEEIAEMARQLGIDAEVMPV